MKELTLTLTPEERKLLLTALCAYVNTTNADIARCSAPDALPTAKRLLEHYQRQKALNAELRAKLNK